MDDASLDALAKSIQRSGILQPISVRRHGDRFQIIAGERRWRAAKRCGMTTIPIVIRQATDEQMLELALVENLQREDLNPIDRAKAYRQFCRTFSLTADDVAERLGEDRSTVANYIRLLELDEALQAMAAGGILSMGHARALLAVRDPHERRRLADAVEQNQLSVRALEEIIRRRKTPDAAATTSTPPEKLRSPHLRDLQTRFEHSLKTKVTIHEGRKKGSGRITIEYYSIDDFDRIASALGIGLD
jgi:ParB family chromosome partitioning protein